MYEHVVVLGHVIVAHLDAGLNPLNKWRSNDGGGDVEDELPRRASDVLLAG